MWQVVINVFTTVRKDNRDIVLACCNELTRMKDAKNVTESNTTCHGAGKSNLHKSKIDGLHYKSFVDFAKKHSE